ncbi:hypothetical protein AYJ59_02015 [Thiomicrospira sp. S5]|nr:hypothetical protein AYJ59_02015 [Thiomicrospira sp. S5]
MACSVTVVVFFVKTVSCQPSDFGDKSPVMSGRENGVLKAINRQAWRFIALVEIVKPMWILSLF